MVACSVVLVNILEEVKVISFYFLPDLEFVV